MTLLKTLSLTLLVSFSLQAAHADNGVGIATAHPLATEAGLKILQQGGNAFDAAVTISSVLAVVEPYSSGIGGGGFWLLHSAKDNRDVMLDGRETAPGKATETMYLDDDGNVAPGRSINGPLAAGIPGEPAALDWLTKNHGKLPLTATLQPAIELARNGFPADRIYLKMLKLRLDAIKQSPAASNTFLANGALPEPGDLIKQPELARTLELLATQGRKGFYQGETARKLVTGVQQAGGIWSADDLKNYTVKVREPVHMRYRNMDITAAALPSSGGIVLAEIFNILAGYDLTELDEATRIHLIVESMRRAYRDRAQYMGDADQVDVPVADLVSPRYALGLRQSIRKDRATPSVDLAPTSNEPAKGTHTTHFSVLDQDGNRVAATLSINFPFGSGFMPEGTGVLLNNEMDDFSAKPGAPNLYGLVGTKANAIAPGKRMLSSMTPAFLQTDDGKLAIIGTPGGSRIITMVLLGALDFQQGKDAQEIVDAPRFHHQYLPDYIQFEKNTFDLDLQKELLELGHELKQNDGTWGNMQIVIKDGKTSRISAASDHRGIGKAVILEPSIQDSE